MLKTFAELFGFEVFSQTGSSANRDPERRISSTRIRELVIEGKIDEAQPILGRYYQVRGNRCDRPGPRRQTVGNPHRQHQSAGRTVPQDRRLCRDRRDAARTFDGVANIGYSPTFDDHLFTVEVHILDFDRNIYGHTIRVNFIKRIRDELKFSSISDLSDRLKGMSLKPVPSCQRQCTFRVDANGTKQGE